jgi:hypothetical protein
VEARLLDYASNALPDERLIGQKGETGIQIGCNGHG